MSSEQRADGEPPRVSGPEGLWLQLSAGQGPLECMWVVAQLQPVLEKAARSQGLQLQCLELEPGPQKGTCKSVLYRLEGPGARAFAQEWQGSLQWVGQSPFRPHHKRKNWFVGLELLTPPAAADWQPEDVRFSTQRAGGPGGQNVNKVETAVRATHLPTGLSVLAQEERSQQRNRQLALARLQQLLQQQAAARVAESQQTRWQQHHQLERGNASKVFKGVSFQLG